MRPWIRASAAALAALGIAACGDSAPPEQVANEPAAAPASEPVAAAEAPAAERGTAEVWSDMRAAWDRIQTISSTEERSIEQFEQLDGEVARLLELRDEMDAGLQQTGVELIKTKRSMLVLQAAILELQKTVTGRVPGQLPEALKVVAAQLWVVQERFPAGELPGEPLAKPPGTGGPASS